MWVNAQIKTNVYIEILMVKIKANETACESLKL